MSSLQLFSYSGQEVRTQLIDGEPWFVTKDVCAVLGIVNVSDAVSRLDEDGVGSTEVMDSMGRRQTASAVNESSLYELVFQSRKETARDFRRWITKEVLPSIRKTGSYGVAEPAELSRMQILQMALDAEQLSMELETKNNELSARISEDAPKVAYVQTFVAADDRITIRTLAGNLGTPEQELRALLVRKGWIYAEQEERWSEKRQELVRRTRYSAYSDKKQYFQNVLVHDAPRFRGGDVMHTLKVTPSGAEAIARLVARTDLDGAA